MPLKESEKKLVGIAMIAGGIAIMIGVGGGQWDAYSSTTTQIGDIRQELETMETTKSSLQTQIQLLEQNTNVPSDLLIRTYTNENREELIKLMLDQVVNKATDTGNRFISLNPLEGEDAADMVPVQAPAPAESDAAEEANTPAAEGEQPAVAAPSPILMPFGYELAVRGNYNSIQQFLRGMSENKELLEISAIKIENEAGVDRGGGPAVGPETVPTDPSRPIKLTAKLKLVLQPQQ